MGLVLPSALQLLRSKGLTNAPASTFVSKVLPSLAAILISLPMCLPSLVPPPIKYQKWAGGLFPQPIMWLALQCLAQCFLPWPCCPGIRTYHQEWDFLYREQSACKTLAKLPGHHSPACYLVWLLSPPVALPISCPLPAPVVGPGDGDQFLGHTLNFKSAEQGHNLGIIIARL